MSSSYRLDQRSPFVIDCHDLRRSAGAMKELTFEAPAPEGMGIEMIAVPSESPMTFNLRLQAVVEGVLVTGEIGVQLHGECARCLGDVDYEDTFAVEELFFYPGKEADEDSPRVIEELIDLESAARDAVVLELPFTPLCQDDCLGLCPACGQDLNADPKHGHDERPDPRWADLAAFGSDPK